MGAELQRERRVKEEVVGARCAGLCGHVRRLRCPKPLKVGRVAEQSYVVCWSAIVIDRIRKGHTGTPLALAPGPAVPAWSGCNGQTSVYALR